MPGAGVNEPIFWGRLRAWRIEDFGNFNYGATGAALGLPDWMLYRVAGVKQVKDHWKDGQHTKILIDPYGDDPRDADMIRRGIEYYRREKRGSASKD